MPASRSDRQLLFAVLALQNHFVTREGLLAAFSAWTLDKSRDLAAILVEQQHLRPAAAEALNVLVEEHLRQHGATPEQSLAALAGLAQLGDAELTASFARFATPPAQGEHDAHAPTLPPTAAAPASGRYRVLRAHARGGLGEVFVAQDQELGREVALKEIRVEYSDYADARDRFVREAEVTGQLEHPGIVPVYGLGTYADGRPYYAMRFIQGDSLKSAIAAFHRDRTPHSPLAGERLVQFRQLLARFITVCQAVHYAHNRQVLHRDLKPDNIMLGDYGETLVVDWGLAKTMGSDSEARTPRSARPVAPRRSGSSETLDGSTLGTPEYMSPEQAAGRLDELGPATDIYALGATLYCLLTGRPPLNRQETPDFVRAIERGDFSPPRRLWPRLAPALEAICLKAMRRDPTDRYATARDLAADLERWLADEPVAVYAEPLAARLSRWIRKNPALVATGATAALLLIAASTTVAFVVGSYNRAIESANREIRAQQETAETRRQEAETVTDLLLDSFQSKQQAGFFRLTTFDEVLDRAAASLASHAELSPRVRRELWTAFGQSYLSIGAYPQAIDSLQHAIALGDTNDGQHNLLLRMDLANAHLFAQQYAQAIAVYEPLLQQMSEQFGPLDKRTQQVSMQLCNAYRGAGRTDDTLRLAQQRYELHRDQLGAGEERTLDSLSNLAFELHSAGRLDEAVARGREGLQIAEKAHGFASEQALYFLSSLAYMLLDAGREDEARQVCERLGAADPAVQAKSLASSSVGALLLLPTATTDWQEIDKHAATLPPKANFSGRCLLALRAGRYADARQAALALLTFREHAAIDRFTLALACHALGETEEARAHLVAGERDLAWLEQPEQRLHLYDRIAAKVLAAEAKATLGK